MSDRISDDELKNMVKLGKAICKQSGMDNFDKTPNGRLIIEVKQSRDDLKTAMAQNRQQDTALRVIQYLIGEALSMPTEDNRFAAILRDSFPDIDFTKL